MIAVKDMLAILDGELLTPSTSPEAAFHKVFASDLMSDVLASAEPGALLVTGLANGHVISTCAVADLSGIVFVQGKRPTAEVVTQARERALPLIATKMTMFEARSRMAGRLEDGGHVRR